MQDKSKFVAYNVVIHMSTHKVTKTSILHDGLLVESLRTKTHDLGLLGLPGHNACSLCAWRRLAGLGC